MRNTIMVGIVAGLVGFAAGNAFWYLASPLWIDRIVAESLPPGLALELVSSGTFVDADSVHRGKGRAMLARAPGGGAVVSLTDFAVTNGPDLFVWIVEASGIKSSSDVTNSQYVSLGPLKGNIGNQFYTIPADADPAAYRSVVIWCKQFGVLFSSAALEPIN
jgi:hypothetical protein